jgi:hypothetical protein
MNLFPHLPLPSQLQTAASTFFAPTTVSNSPLITQLSPAWTVANVGAQMGFAHRPIFFSPASAATEFPLSSPQLSHAAATPSAAGSLLRIRSPSPLFSNLSEAFDGTRTARYLLESRLPLHAVPMDYAARMLQNQKQLKPSELATRMCMKPLLQMLAESANKLEDEAKAVQAHQLQQQQHHCCDDAQCSDVLSDADSPVVSASSSPLAATSAAPETTAETEPDTFLPPVRMELAAPQLSPAAESRMQRVEEKPAEPPPSASPAVRLPLTPASSPTFSVLLPLPPLPSSHSVYVPTWSEEWPSDSVRLRYLAAGRRKMEAELGSLEAQSEEEAMRQCFESISKELEQLVKVMKEEYFRNACLIALPGAYCSCPEGHCWDPFLQVSNVFIQSNLMHVLQPWYDSIPRLESGVVSLDLVLVETANSLLAVMKSIGFFLLDPERWSQNVFAFRDAIDGQKPKTRYARNGYQKLCLNLPVCSAPSSVSSYCSEVLGWHPR